MSRRKLQNKKNAQCADLKRYSQSQRKYNPDKLSTGCINKVSRGEKIVVPQSDKHDTVSRWPWRVFTFASQSVTAINALDNLGVASAVEF